MNRQRDEGDNEAATAFHHWRFYTAARQAVSRRTRGRMPSRLGH
jgi:hypothetical protein